MKQKTYEFCLSLVVLIDKNSHENVNFVYCEYSHYIQQRNLNICEHIYRSAIINKRFVMSTSTNKKDEKNWHGYIWIINLPVSFHYVQQVDVYVPKYGRNWR
jgi:hypothetical protein